VFDRPLGVSDALAHVDEWLSRPHVRFALPGPRHLEIAFGLLREVKKTSLTSVIACVEATMTAKFSTYEAKARFSEVIRRVRAGQRVVVTFHGQDVAEIRPIEKRSIDLGQRVLQLEERGVLVRAGGSRVPWTAVARRPGALKRFLAERD
jgi:prevent-host-death family protein